MGPILTLCLALAWGQDAQPTVETGYEALRAGEAARALEDFYAVLAADPESAGAMEGVVWAHLQAGDPVSAGEMADRRRALADGETYQRIWLQVVAQVPARRGEAIAGYRALLESNPLDEEAHLWLARSLSWAGEPAAALPHWEQAASAFPGDLGVLLGLAESARFAGLVDRAAEALASAAELSPDSPRVHVEGAWQAVAREDWEAFHAALEMIPEGLEGRKALEAAAPVVPEPQPDPVLDALRVGWEGDLVRGLAELRRLEADHSDDVRVWQGLVQFQRWQGLKGAQADVERGLERFPDDPVLLAERGHIALADGRPKLALADAERALELQPGYLEAIRVRELARDTRIGEVAVQDTWSRENTGFLRHSVGVDTGIALGGTGRLEAGVAWTRFSDPEVKQDRVSIGLAPQVELTKGLVAHADWQIHLWDQGRPTFTAALGLQWSVANLPLQIEVEARHRPIVDSPQRRGGIAALRSVGSGGSTLYGVREGLQVNEGAIKIGGAPHPSTFVYGEFRGGVIRGGNRRINVSGGAGHNVLAFVPGAEQVSAVLRYDLYLLSHGETRLGYFSPKLFAVHTPRLEVRWEPLERWSVGAEGGIPLQAGLPPGFLVGAFLQVDLAKRVFIESRFRITDDTEFRISAVTARLGGRF